MKKLFTLTLFLSIMHFAGAKQALFYNAGVYLNYDDFINNHLTNAIDVKMPGSKFGFMFLRKTLKISNGNISVKYPPGSVYGYYYCGVRYRYSAGGELYAPEDYYRVEEQGSLIIYSSVFWGGQEYFYSADISAPIHRLNINNLEKDFIEYSEFMTAIRKLKKQSGLSTRDKKGHFLINTLFYTLFNTGGN